MFSFFYFGSDEVCWPIRLWGQNLTSQSHIMWLRVFLYSSHFVTFIPQSLSITEDVRIIIISMLL